MKLELGAPVLVELRDGEIRADTGLYHLPNGSLSHTLCGLPGVDYAYGGAIRSLRLCGVCRRHAPRLHRAPRETAAEGLERRSSSAGDRSSA